MLPPTLLKLTKKPCAFLTTGESPTNFFIWHAVCKKPAQFRGGGKAFFCTTHAVGCLLI